MDSFEKNILTALIRLRIENYMYGIASLTLREEDATLNIKIQAISKKRLDKVIIFDKTYDIDVKFVHVFKDIDYVFLQNVSKKDKRRMKRRAKYR